MKKQKLVIQPYLMASSPLQKTVLEYLMQRYGENLKNELVYIIWSLLTERYLVDALYTQNPSSSEIEYEGKRIIAILAGEQIKIKELLDIHPCSSKDLVNSLENLLASSNAIKKPVPEPKLETKKPVSESKLDLSTRCLIEEQQEEQPKFDLEQFAEDAYQYRIKQVGESAGIASEMGNE